MCRNTDLKSSVQALAIKTLPIFEAHVPQLEDGQRNRMMISTNLQNLEKDIKGTGEFDSARETMQADKQVMSLQGRMVGESNALLRISNVDECLFSFLRQLYTSGSRLDQTSLDEAYGNFEDIFYLDTLKVRETTPLHNFSSSMDEIELSNEIRIVRVPNETSPNEFEGYLARQENLLRSPFVIERVSLRRKVFSDVKRDPKDDLTEQELMVECFDNVVTALRILKPSGVYRREEIRREHITFRTFFGTSIWQPFHRSVAFGRECAIETNEVESLIANFRFIDSCKDSRFSVAANRLSSGRERRSNEDTLIDYMIGLEALYLPDGNHELSFRIALRAAHVLETESAMKQGTFEFLKSAYDKRSIIVHGTSGKKGKIAEEELERVEEILRDSLRIWVERPEVFSKEALNKVLFS